MTYHEIMALRRARWVVENTTALPRRLRVFYRGVARRTSLKMIRPDYAPVIRKSARRG